MLKRGTTFLAGLLTGLLATGALLLLIAKPRGEPVHLNPPPTPGPLTVHVSGAVQNPGVYTLPRGSIVEDALQAAGGPTAEARLDALNLAARLQDGEQIALPGLPPTSSNAQGSSAAGGAGAAPAPGKININLATAGELEALPGIGPSLAQAIVGYREANGPFTTVDDLLKVPGIGPAKLEQMREWIAVP